MVSYDTFFGKSWGCRNVMVCKDVKKINKMLVDKNAALKSHNYIILDRNKYRKTVAAIGITTKDVLDDIEELDINDTWECKEDDNMNFPGEVWITKKILYGKKIYIKIKIKEDVDNMLLVMSYHFDGMN